MLKVQKLSDMTKKTSAISANAASWTTAETIAITDTTTAISWFPDWHPQLDPNLVQKAPEALAML